MNNLEFDGSQPIKKKKKITVPNFFSAPDPVFRPEIQ